MRDTNALFNVFPVDNKSGINKLIRLIMSTT